MVKDCISAFRYVFSGAEVFAEDFSDDDDEIESDSDPENDQQGNYLRILYTMYCTTHLC